MLPVSTEQNKEIGASQPLATKTSLAPNGNVPENSATAARFISAGTCPTVNVNTANHHFPPESAQKSSSSSSNSTAGKSSSPLVKHSTLLNPSAGHYRAGHRHHKGLQRSASQFSPDLDSHPIVSNGREHSNGRRQTMATSLVTSTAIPVRCGSCSNLSILNMPSIPPPNAIYSGVDHHAGAIVPTNELMHYDPHGAVNLLPAPLTTTQIYGTAGRRHSMYMPAPSEYGGFYSEQQHAAIYGFAGFPPAPPPLPYYSMAGPPMDYEAFKRTMKAVHKQEEMAAAKQKLDDGASDDLSFSCVRLCCGDEAKILWAIVAIVCFGFLTALLAALYLF